ncbi:DUF5362 family protein [Prolixibacteraceae bacterium Z1-6]|uniref:DUF5362 family protein n=1 Tax=Draconibacterium aestuarii TaxID=2998507 RepID=A0A9X3F9K6_9BACT|nr:DUF5362 family protein [Prolixibacteraceae bacterium Z1-6]
MTTENETMGQVLPESPRELAITAEIGEQLNGAGNWGKFLAILGFVFMGLMVFGGFIMSIIFLVMPGELSSGMPFPPFLFGFIYLVMGAIYFLPILYLYRFSSNIKSAILSKDQNQLTVAFKNLKAHYRFIGIFTIVIFALYILVFIVMVFAGIFAGLATNLTGITA